MIKYYEQFFKEKDYIDLLNHIDTIGWKDRGQDYDESRYTTHYNFQIINEKEGVKDIQIPLVRTALEIVKQSLGEEYYPHNLYFNSYKYGDEIQAHVDRETTTKNNRTLIIYCTKEWQKDWHGETLLYDGNILKGGNLPMPNSAILFDSKIQHSMAPISRYCKELRNILVFQLEGKKWLS
jgi:Rps23 Pro-64 3,4-dihydroxylase Tpa1-like proline 4-hydroxylase